VEEIARSPERQVGGALYPLLSTGP